MGKYEIGMGLEREKEVMITKKKKISGACNVVAEEPHVKKSDVRMHMSTAFYCLLRNSSPHFPSYLLFCHHFFLFY